MKREPSVLYEDNHLLGLNKPATMATVPDESGDESLLDWGKQYLKTRYAKPGAVFLGVVQRLDRPVSGAIVLARTSKAAARLTQHLREKTASKQYWALVEGEPTQSSGAIEHYLWKDEAKNRVHVVGANTAGAKLAQTRWRLLARLGAWSWLELEPLTGRSHQLRVACAKLGTPIAGDLKYGARQALEDASIALHARELAFPHPTRMERIRLQAPPPAQAPWDLLPH